MALLPATMKIASEFLPFAGPLFAISLLAGVFLHPWMALPPFALMLFVVWFFRDPEREVPDDAAVLVSPADGKIIKAGGGNVSIFMNVFSVHVCRTPAGGTVAGVDHRPGRFLAAFDDAAPEQNERTEIRLVDGARSVRFTLVAGLIARRIVCKVVPGQRLATGDRVGLIRFGSRVDVALPDEATICVRVGERVSAGETVIARLSGPPPNGPGPVRGPRPTSGRAML
jgi:phosphatidylserine decarboxylase